MTHFRLRLRDAGGLLDEADDAGDGQAHDVEVVAFDARNPAGGVALDAVGAGLVEGLGRGAVAIELALGDVGEDDVGGLDRAACAGAGGDGDSGEDLVGAAGEPAEHAAGVVGVGGLGEDLVAGDYGGVGAEDDELAVEAGVSGEDRGGFFFGEPLDVGGGGLGGARGLVDVGGLDIEEVSGLGEELAAAGRGGGEDQAEGLRGMGHEFLIEGTPPGVGNQPVY